ncbi:MAG: YggS family pyridoxal phosphate-dependent enzyme [Clostridia bacterium]|nr:YggS family pyridoxal phosphate-dependent enzyme [Clostridia bacterium]
MTERSSTEAEEYALLEKNVRTVRENIEKAKLLSPYGQEVTLLAATKTRSARIINMLPSLGITSIGENRVQELLAKYDELDREKLDIQFIGALQTNKVRQIIDKVSLIQSVDRLSLAEEIDRQAKLHSLTMDVLIELNIGHEENKSGIDPDRTAEFFKRMSDFENVRVRGLMCVPPVCVEKERQREYFQRILRIYIDIFPKIMDNIKDRENKTVLSCGMSGDYPTAVECGSTMVRIGSAIFGPRIYKENN